MTDDGFGTLGGVTLTLIVCIAVSSICILRNVFSSEGAAACCV